MIFAIILRNIPKRKELMVEDQEIDNASFFVLGLHIEDDIFNSKFMINGKR